MRRSEGYNNKNDRLQLTHDLNTVTFKPRRSQKNLVLPGFVIGERSYNMKHAGDTVLIEDAERKFSTS